MKTINFFSFAKSAKTMSVASVATMLFISLFGFTSCQQDNDPLTEAKSDEMEQTGDTITTDSLEFVNNTTFNYGSLGPVAVSDSVKKLDLGFNTTTEAESLQTRCVLETYVISAVSKELLTWAAQQAYNNVKGKAFGVLLEKVLGDGQNTTLNKLNNINAKLDDVLRYAKDIHNKAKEAENAKLMTERMEYYGTLNRVTKDAIGSILESKGNQKEIEDIIDKWAGKKVNGSSAYLITAQYMDFLSGRCNSSNLAMPGIYDKYVYQTTPWEHEGYDNRDNLRLADVSLSVSAYILGKLYCELHNLEVTENTLDNSFNNFFKVYSDNLSVQRRNDVIVCQIKGAHIVFNKKLVNRDIKAHPWRKDGQEFVMIKNASKENFIKNFMFGESGLTADDVLNRSLKPEEATAIYNYYNSGKSDEDKLTFDQILKQAGFDMTALNASKKHVMTLCTGGSIVNNGHFDSFDNEWSFRFTKAAVTSNNTFMVSDFHIGKELLHCRWHIGKHSHSYSCKGWKRYDDNNQFFRTDIASRITE